MLLFVYFVYTDYNESLKSFLNECILMKKFNHPNILPIIGLCLECNHESQLPFMLFPFMVNGDLKSYLKKKRRNAAHADQFPEVYMYLINICMCSYCTYMH